MQELIEQLEVLIPEVKNGNVLDKVYWLEKEKQQIIEAHQDAAIKIISDVTPDILEMCENDFEDAEQYYNETFKK